MSDGRVNVMFDLVATLVQTLYLQLLLNNPDKARKPVPIRALLIGGMYVMIEVLSLMNAIVPVKAALGLLAIVFTAWYGYGHSIPKSLLFGFLYLTASTFGEVIAVQMVAFAGRDPAVLFRGGQWGIAEFYVMSSLASLLIIILLRRIMNRTAFSYPFWSILPLCFSCVAFLVVWTEKLQYGMNDQQFSAFFLGSAILLIISVVTGTLVNERYMRLSEEARAEKMARAELERRHAYYEDKLRDEQRVLGLYHDLKNHLLLLENRAEAGRAVPAIAQLRSQIDSYENYHKTGNAFLDVIIRDKAQKAREQQIDFSVVLHFVDSDFIEPFDISSLFGNALDNAIEASQVLPPGERIITVRGNRVQDLLTVVIENNMAETGKTGLKTTKHDPFLHGFGLDRIEKVAQKYGGQSTVKQGGGRFALTMIFPIPA